MKALAAMIGTSLVYAATGAILLVVVFLSLLIAERWMHNA